MVCSMTSIFVSWEPMESSLAWSLARESSIAGLGAGVVGVGRGWVGCEGDLPFLVMRGGGQQAVNRGCGVLAGSC
jgi:hypothetical protein